MSYDIKIRSRRTPTDPLYLYYNNRIGLTRISPGRPPIPTQMVLNDPTLNDPNLYVYPAPGPFDQPGANDPDVVWNLAGRPERVVFQDPFRPPPPNPPANFMRPTLEQLREFVVNVGPEQTLLERNVLEQQIGGYLISKTNMDQAFITPDNINELTTFPNQLVSSIIKTCEAVLYMLSEDSNEIRLGNTERISGWSHSKDVINNIVRRFLRALFPEATERDVDDAVGAFRQRPEQNLREIVISYCTVGVTQENFSNPQVPADPVFNSAAEQKYSTFRIIQALLSITPEEVVKRSFDSLWSRNNFNNFPNMSSNMWENCHFSSSFVRTYDTYQALNRQGRTSTSMAASLEPEYNFYIKRYEDSLQIESITEGVLPNIYIRNLYTRNEQIQRREGNLEDPEQLFDIEDYKYIIELGPPPKTEEWLRALQNRGRTEFEYYSFFGLAASQAEEDVKQSVSNRMSTLVFPSNQLELMQQISERKHVPPMNIEVSFNRSNWGPASVAMEENRCSAAVLLALATPVGMQGMNDLASLSTQDEYDININYIDRISQNEVGVSPYSQTTLRSYDWQTVFSFGQREAAPPIDYTLFSGETGDADMVEWRSPRFQLEQVTDCLSTVRAYATGRGGEQYDRYGAIITPSILPSSEAIGYRIEKQKIEDQSYIQNIMIANGSGNRRTSYVDTQIKYDEGYYYSLFEYRMIYGIEYQIFMTCPEIPSWLVAQHLGLVDYVNGLASFDQDYPNIPLDQLPLMKFSGYVNSKPATKLLEIPIYNTDNSSLFPEYLEPDEIRRTSFDLSRYTSAGGIAYPVGRVLDRPPTAATMMAMPIRNNDRQVILNINLETGAYLNSNAQPYIAIGEDIENMEKMYRHQKSLEYYELPEGSIEFKNEGIGQIKRVILYRTTVLDLDVEDYNSLYGSFNPGISDAVTVRSLTTNERVSRQNPDFELIGAYDLVDDLEPNQIYYYTCVVEDIHNQVSNPSNIFSVKLVSEKGFLVPEINSVSPKKISNKKPTKDLARYIQIDASNIQSFPYVYQDGEELNGETSLGQFLGDGIGEKDFILRFTSKDSGRKFDLKLSFVVEVDGHPINGRQT